MLGIESGEPRKALSVQEMEQVALIRRKVLADQGAIQEHLKAVLLANSDIALDAVLQMVRGERGSATVQLDAAKWWLEHSGAMQLQGKDGRPLHELPLDQLETVLATALDNARQLRAIPSTAEHVPEVTQVTDSTE